MNPDHDPLLTELFAHAEQPLPAADFSAGVWEGINQQRRQQLVLRLALAALLIIGEWLLDAPLQQLVQQLTQAVTQSLVSVDSRWLELALTPVNSAASIVAVILLSARYIYRRLGR